MTHQMTLTNDSRGSSMTQLLTTKSVADLLNVNEKKIYTLVSHKGLPATKVTGKWLFPKHLVEQWIEANTINYPETAPNPEYKDVLLVGGSNDPLLEKAIAMHNSAGRQPVVLFANLGSMGGLKLLRQGRCHVAASHLLQDDDAEYNFDFAKDVLGAMPAVVNFCRREQGLLLPKNNPKKITRIEDLGRNGIRIVNRPLGTGTRLLLDKLLAQNRISAARVEGYQNEVHSHLQVGLAVLTGSADAGPAIRAVADMLDLDFLPLRWERFDLILAKERFFQPDIQRFLGLMNEQKFRETARSMSGYDISNAGQMVFPAK